MLQKDKLHHAYCFFGKKDQILGELEIFFEKEMDIPTKKNPDFLYGDFDVFTIENARDIKDRHQMKAFGGKKKIFVISANSMTHEAQNSVLKMLEEPASETHFFLIFPTPERLIPTLLSRLYVVVRDDTNEAESDRAIESFIGASKSERMRQIKGIIDEKDKEKALDFLNKLESYLEKDIASKNNFDRVSLLSEIIKAKQYLNHRGSSVKMLLE